MRRAAASDGWIDNVVVEHADIDASARSLELLHGARPSHDSADSFELILKIVTFKGSWSATPDLVAQMAPLGYTEVIAATPWELGVEGIRAYVDELRAAVS